MTQEQILEQLFDNNFVTETFDIIKNSRLKMQLKSLTPDDYLEADKILTTFKGSKMFVLQKFALEKLCRGLQTFYGKEVKEFQNYREAKDFIEKLPVTQVDRMIKIQEKFEKEIAAAISPEAIEENFFEAPGLQEKQEQSPKE